MFRRIGSALIVVMLLAASGMGFLALRSDLESDIYRERLRELSLDYEQLARQYDAAVRKSAVTELRVEAGVLSVLVRAANGVLREVVTPYDPSGEIYVDFIVLNDRLWIRRVFDQNTPPNQGTVIDPVHADIDWMDRGDDVYGKAVYRSLSEGRWAVTMTGSGSLGLERIADNSPVELVSPPLVRDFSELEASAKKELERVGIVTLIRRAVAGH